MHCWLRSTGMNKPGHRLDYCMVKDIVLPEVDLEKIIARTRLEYLDNKKVIEEDCQQVNPGFFFSVFRLVSELLSK